MFKRKLWHCQNSTRGRRQCKSKGHWWSKRTLLRNTGQQRKSLQTLMFTRRSVEPIIQNMQSQSGRLCVQNGLGWSGRESITTTGQLSRRSGKRPTSGGKSNEPNWPRRRVHASRGPNAARTTQIRQHEAGRFGRPGRLRPGRRGHSTRNQPSIAAAGAQKISKKEDGQKKGHQKTKKIKKQILI